MLAGPTTLLATLNSLQMGFRTLALEKRSAEVWEVLGAVKTEFGQVWRRAGQDAQEARRSQQHHRRRRGAHARDGAPAQERGSTARGRAAELLPGLNAAAEDEGPADG
jgi:DNA recombination protein RmuC